MDRNPIEEARFSDTGYSYTLSLISGKYKPVILYCLMEYEPVRFNQMQRYLGRVADKTLSQNLKELERDGLIRRKMYPEVPPRVEYSLTERGSSLISSGSKEPRSALELRRVSLGAHWVDSRESSLLRRLERGREIGL